MQLQITPNPVIVEPEVERPNTGDNEGDKRSKEKEFAQHIFKAVQELSKGIEDLRQQNCNNNQGQRDSRIVPNCRGLSRFA